jgi:hypothetical protein
MGQLQFLEKSTLTHFPLVFEAHIIVWEKFRGGGFAGLIKILRAALRENDSFCFFYQAMISGGEFSAPENDLIFGGEARMKGKDLLLFDFTHIGHYS